MKLKNLLNELNFATQAAFDRYNDAHSMRNSTIVTIAGKKTTAGQAEKKTKKTSTNNNSNGAEYAEDDKYWKDSFKPGDKIKDGDVLDDTDYNTYRLGKIGSTLTDWFEEKSQFDYNFTPNSENGSMTIDGGDDSPYKLVMYSPNDDGNFIFGFADNESSDFTYNDGLDSGYIGGRNGIEDPQFIYQSMRYILTRPETAKFLKGEMKPSEYKPIYDKLKSELMNHSSLKKENTMKLKNLLNEETFTATNKASGKTSVFKTKDSRDAAIKAGTHSKEGGSESDKTDGKTSKVNIFDKPKSKSDDAPADSTKPWQTAKKPKSKYDDAPADSTKPWQTKKDSSTDKSSSDMGVDKVVYNTRTKSVGIVRMADERGETKTDADGNVNTSELEPYNPMKYPHQKDAKVAPSTQKEVDARGLWNPFAQDKETSKEEPTQTASEPKKKRPGNPSVNKQAKKKAEQYGITPQKLGNEKYKEAMFQAAVSALTDSNFHSEARELVAAIEGKPELAKRPEYPSIKDPKYKEKMADIRKNSADGSIYMNGTGDIDDYGTDVSQASGWDGVDAADSIAFTLRMNGFHKEADLIQSVFDNKPYMKTEGRISLSKLMNEQEDDAFYVNRIVSRTGLRGSALEKFAKENDINLSKVFDALTSKKLKPMDLMSAVVGYPNNKYAKAIIKTFSK